MSGMGARDPRTDPRRGDVLRKGKRQRKVLGRSEFRGPWVCCQTPSDEKNEIVQALRLEYWQKWAASAEAI